MSVRPLNVALLGFGTVGSEVSRLMRDNASDLAARIGAPLQIVGVAVRDPERPRGGLDPTLVTTDALKLVSRGDVDIVVEVMGGIEPARTLIHAAIEHGAAVVSANKALLAARGPELHAAAKQHGVDLYYEAAVGGAIPLLRPLRESLVGDNIYRVMGIVNGTTNFILTRMDEEGADYSEVLAQAQALGYAEADPIADVGGLDAAAKAAILASLAFHTAVTVEDVHCEGITGVTAADVANAKLLNSVVKLLAVAERTPDGVIVRVHPAMVPRTHPLAGVRDAFNAVFVEADAAGQLMFYGRGAGGTPTASAVLGDVVTVARNRILVGRAPTPSDYASLPVLPIGRSKTRYFVGLDVDDRSGVLAKVATCFSEHGVSIQDLHQDGRGAAATLAVMTHTALEHDLAATVETLRGLDVVKAVTSVMRVIGEG